MWQESKHATAFSVALARNWKTRIWTTAHIRCSPYSWGLDKRHYNARPCWPLLGLSLLFSSFVLHLGKLTSQNYSCSFGNCRNPKWWAGPFIVAPLLHQYKISPCSLKLLLSLLRKQSIKPNCFICKISFHAHVMYQCQHLKEIWVLSIHRVT